MNQQPTFNSALKELPELKMIDKIFEAVEKAGGVGYFVGGFVRDSIMNRNSKDIDIEVFGLSMDDLHKALSTQWTVNVVGKAFGVYKIGSNIDVSIPRFEEKIGDKHTDFEIKLVPNATLKEAAARRDFTINAIYMDRDGNFHDPYNGIEDIKNGVIRHTSEKFGEDPLRVLRAMQFSARFDFEVHEDTIRECSQLKQDHLPKERLYEEWKKFILKAIKPSRGLNFLHACGWTDYYPELKDLIGCQQDPIHHPEGDVWAHTLHCLDYFASNVRDLETSEHEKVVIGFGVLLHDVGKPITTKINPKDNRWHAYGHEREGVPFAETFMRRLTAEHTVIRDIKPLVEFHMKPMLIFKEARRKEASILNLAYECGNIHRLLHVVDCDVNGRPPKQKSPEWKVFFNEKLDELNCRYKPQPALIQGQDLINIGFKQSAQFKVWLQNFYTDQINLQLRAETKDKRLQFFALKHGVISRVDLAQFGVLIKTETLT